MQKTEHLGEVVIPSGTVVLIDMGLLDMWCHDRPPLLPEGILSSEEATLAANDAVDLRIDGPDADEAGKEWHGNFIYDIPKHGLSKFHDFFGDFVAEHKLKASISVLEGRVTHRARIDHAIQFGGGAGPFMFHGITAMAVTDIPSDKALPVVGLRMEEEEFSDRWREIQLLVREGSPIVESRNLGFVAVDKARLMFVDADALKDWQHEVPMDGKADFVFWGADAQLVAKKFGAPELLVTEGKGVYGWEDMEVHKAADLGLSIEDYREDERLRFATDFRPHSHHYYVMKQVRKSQTESGELKLGAATACAFMTTWGDGFFPVLQDIDREGKTVRLRIDLGNDEIVDNLLALSS